MSSGVRSGSSVEEVRSSTGVDQHYRERDTQRMDTLKKPIKSGTDMNVRHVFFFGSTLLITALSSGCGSSSSRDGANTADDVSSGSSDSSDSSKDTAKTDEPANDTKEMPHGPKSTNDGNSVPEDYTLTDRDCIELAKHYGVVQKADQMAALNPKLTTAQKEQAEGSIDSAVTKLRENWENGCRTSLVGGVVDRERLKCAMSSKSVKAFDECINGEPKK